MVSMMISQLWVVDRLLKGGNFTAEEVERLKLLVDTSDLARSAVVRNKAIVACPLGEWLEYLSLLNLKMIYSCEISLRSCGLALQWTANSISEKG